MINIQKKIEYIINGKINELCPYESIILYYMIQISDQGIYTDISISDLYNITDIYNLSFKKINMGHDNCLCKKFFNNKKLEKNDKIKKMKNYLFSHYDNLNKIGNIYDNFLNKFSKINWLINHQIVYGSNSNCFKLYKSYNLIGYDNDNVFIFYIKPQFNNLNYNNILIESIFDTFLIKNIKKVNNTEKDNNKDKHNKELEDYTKFYNKKIKTIVFSLDNENYYLIDWNNSQSNQDLIECESNKNMLVKLIRDKIDCKYKIECKYIYNFYKYWKKEYQLDKPTKIIEKIIGKYEDNEYIDKMPHFILKFFENIEKELDISKDNKSKINILQNYDSKDFFTNELNSIILKSVNKYLDIEDDSDEEDSCSDVNEILEIIQ
jgi:hypothetical protein